jgi:sulfoxide reductase heme-binding subunit YedZ
VSELGGGGEEALRVARVAARAPGPDATRETRDAPSIAPARRPGRRDPASVAKPVVFALALLPFAVLATQLYLVYTGQNDDLLGAEPVERLEHETGQLALRFVAFTLAVTPLRKLTGWNWLVKYRRMLGLFAFFYASAHLAVYAGLDLELDVGEVTAEIVKRPYITLGMLSWLMLLALAVTSTKGWIRRLGGRRWNRLHQLSYAVAVGGTVHFWWSVKKDVTEPLLYALVFAALLGYRVWERRGQRAPVVSAAG